MGFLDKLFGKKKREQELKAEEEALKRAAEEEARKKAEEEAKKQAEAEAARKAAEEAAKKAESYLKHGSFSRSGLIEQLEYEGFTAEQAVYGVEANGF